MRTVSEDLNPLINLKGEITPPPHYLDEKEQESVFYKLGEVRSTVYGNFEERPMPTIINTIEQVICEEKDVKQKNLSKGGYYGNRCR